MKIISTILCLIQYLISGGLLWVLLCPRCIAFEPGYYEEDSNYSELSTTIRSADLCFAFSGTDEIELSGSPITSAQLQNAFLREKRKKLLAIRFDPNCQEHFDEVKKLAQAIGYERLIVFHERVMGIQLYYDSNTETHSTLKRPIKALISESDMYNRYFPSRSKLAKFRALRAHRN